jgi:predicted ABC-class ATPase
LAVNKLKSNINQRYKQQRLMKRHNLYYYLNSEEIKSKQQQRKKKRVLTKIMKKVCKKWVMMYTFQLIISNRWFRDSQLWCNHKFNFKILLFNKMILLSKKIMNRSWMILMILLILLNLIRKKQIFLRRILIYLIKIL